jgi:hypothetical protein
VSITNLHGQQGKYRFNNVTFQDNFISEIYFYVRFQIVWDVRVVGRIKGGKKTVWFGNGYGKVEYHPNDRSKERNITGDEFEQIVQMATRYLVRTQN